MTEACRSLQFLSPRTHRYDHRARRWWPQCPHGDECSGCDAIGRCTKAPTAGEQLVGRALAKEKRAGGVEHYVPGQHAATIMRCVEYGSGRPVEVGRITYVDVMGHACVVLTLRYTDEDGDWFPTWVGRAGQEWEENARPVDRDAFTLSEKMLAELDSATYEEIPSA